MKKLLFILTLAVLLVACGKSKEQIVDKCLLRANQTFPDSLNWKIDHFENCMNDHDYYLSDHKICTREDPTYVLSATCYQKD
jgi:major membrane immunogen (membrane-anchored lipoprotein)